MTKYRILWVRGDYRARQLEANAAKAVLYVEQHFNALAIDDPASMARNRALCVVASNAGKRTREIAADYLARICREFGIGSDGVIVGPERGNWNLYYAKAPAILLEPLYASDPTQAAWIRSEEGQDRLAAVLVDWIRANFPDGGKVAFSVGHKYKTSLPKDRGANVIGGGSEADYAERVLKKAEALLISEVPL